jgi:hypothetical protein
VPSTVPPRLAHNLSTASRTSGLGDIGALSGVTSSFNYQDTLAAAAAAAAAGLNTTSHTSSTEASPTPGFDFGSETLNLEYAILSSMLANPAFNALTSDAGPTIPSIAAPYAGLPDISMIDTSWVHPAAAAAAAANAVTTSSAADLVLSGGQVQARQSPLLSPTAAALLAQSQSRLANNDRSLSQSLSPSVPMTPQNGMASSSMSGSSSLNRDGRDLYESVQEPFDHTPGFHHLLQHLKER